MRFVMKFGGTAINSANKVIHVANLIKSQKQKESNDIVGVVSAVRGMTDGILSISDSIKRGDKTSIEDFINNARDIHTTIIDQAIADKKIKNAGAWPVLHDRAHDGRSARSSYMRHPVHRIQGQPHVAVAVRRDSSDVGLVIIAFHQYWRSPAAVIVSAVGWILADRGVILLTVPGAYTSAGNAV